MGESKKTIILNFFILFVFVIIVSIGLSAEKRSKLLFYFCIGSIFFIISACVHLIKNKKK